MDRKPIFVVSLNLYLSILACNLPIASDESTLSPATLTSGSTTATTPDSQVTSPGTPVSQCGRIDLPGQYYLTTSLDEAPLEISVTAELAEPYTGDMTLDRSCIEITSPGVSFDCQGQTLSGTGQEGAGTAGIFISGSPTGPLPDVTIRNCTMTNHDIGLYAGNLEGGTINNNIAPRIRGLKHQRIYRIDRAREYGALAPHCASGRTPRHQADGKGVGSPLVSSPGRTGASSLCATRFSVNHGGGGGREGRE